MTSLKEKLHTLVNEKGYLSYEDFVGVCLREGYKVSNGERRMRELCNDFPIEPVMKKSKRNTSYVGGWKYEKGPITFISPRLQEYAKEFGLKVKPPVYPTSLKPFKETKQQPLL